jgi:sphingolipid delta-4 desaturase
MAPNAQSNAPLGNNLGHFMVREDFKWSDTDEPHAVRRAMILDKYPQIKELYGYDPDQKWQTLAYIVTQMFIAWFLRDSEWRAMLVVAYGVGGLINHALSLAVHELSHGMMFEGGLANELFGFLCNVPQGIPSFIMFKKYHNEHHLYQGVDPIDVDVPSQWCATHIT